MDANANPQPTRRTRLIAAGLVGVTLGFGGVVAATDAIDDPAAVSERAVRVAMTTTTTTHPMYAGDLLFPINPEPRCELVNGFGDHSGVHGSGGHQGLDIGADLGQEVYAVKDGELIRQSTYPESANAGNGWVLMSDEGDEFRYYHLDGFADGLEKDDRVEEGDVIGYVGDTGNATPGGWHLHFEYRPGPKPENRWAADPVDPLPALDVPSTCKNYLP